jgi:UDP-N-acetylmuramyl pentapeptide phosphotransferase/UDP-N-acetylglucosamine-1-phosphate transferase
MVSLLVAFVASTLLVYGYATWLEQQRVFEIPNARSSHRTPTPSGGGLPLLLVAFAGTLTTAMPLQRETVIVLAAAACLAAVSWYDDRKPMRPHVRFGMHILAVVVGLASLPSDMIILFPGSPILADRLVVGICWLWFINLFNFMDGIDGLAGSETMAITIGVLLLAPALAISPDLQVLALWLTGAAAGFLVWNWQRARIFMGDVGSIPLGFLLGWLLIHIAAADAAVAAFVLPLCFLADATYTLLRRILSGERFWEPHRQHFYQQATQRGRSHGTVVQRVWLVNIVLIASALLSLTWPVFAACAAALSVSLMLLEFAGAWDSLTEQGRRAEPGE